MVGEVELFDYRGLCVVISNVMCMVFEEQAEVDPHLAYVIAFCASE